MTNTHIEPWLVNITQLTAQKQDLSSAVFIIPAIYLSQHGSKLSVQLREPRCPLKTKNTCRTSGDLGTPLLAALDAKDCYSSQSAIGAPKCTHHGPTVSLLAQVQTNLKQISCLHGPQLSGSRRAQRPGPFLSASVHLFTSAEGPQINSGQ